MKPALYFVSRQRLARAVALQRSIAFTLATPALPGVRILMLLALWRFRLARVLSRRDEPLRIGLHSAAGGTTHRVRSWANATRVCLRSL